jgi:hypothetical protein
VKVQVLHEAGYWQALEGIALSRLQPLENMPAVALRLAAKGEPHCKFLRQMVIWAKITAPWYWWKHFDTYRVGVEQQSTSTMYKILSRPLEMDDFEAPIELPLLDMLNLFIERREFDKAIAHLPGAYLYTRIVTLSYSTARRIIEQRKGHRLPEWEAFAEQLVEEVCYPEFLEQGER